MRTFIIIAVIALTGGLLSLPYASEKGARVAMEEKHRAETWAPGVTYWAARINMRLWRYEVAVDLMESGLATWPQAWWRKEGTYYTALSHEAIDRPDDARRWYQTYIDRYPEHKYIGQAHKRIANIDAQE